MSIARPLELLVPPADNLVHFQFGDALLRAQEQPRHSIILEECLDVFACLVLLGNGAFDHINHRHAREQIIVRIMLTKVDYLVPLEAIDDGALDRLDELLNTGPVRLHAHRGGAQPPKLSPIDQPIASSGHEHVDLRSAHDLGPIALPAEVGQHLVQGMVLDHLVIAHDAPRQPG